MIRPHVSPSATITATQNGWRLGISKGNSGIYRVAQLDDYAGQARGAFPHAKRATLRLRCRLSSACLPGTWGFGLWNNPFGLAPRQWLPCLPNTAWFFHASGQNHLSFGNQAGSGFLAQAFSAPLIPAGALIPAWGLGLLGLWKPLARRLRHMASAFIRDESRRLEVDVTEWHEYRLRWSPLGVEWAIDGNPVFESPISPNGPLGFVLWMDNQFMAWRPDGTLQAGTLANDEAWMDVEQWVVSSG